MAAGRGSAKCEHRYFVFLVQMFVVRAEKTQPIGQFSGQGSGWSATVLSQGLAWLQCPSSEAHSTEVVLTRSFPSSLLVIST